MTGPDTGPVHVGAAIAEAVPAITGSTTGGTEQVDLPIVAKPGADPERSSRPGPTGDTGAPEQTGLTERTGWKNADYAAEANDPVLVAVDDDHIEHTAALVEKGAKAEVDRVLLLCGSKLREGVPLDLIAEALDETAAETWMLAAACARARAATAGVEL